jgi:uncharacterized protein
MSKVEKIYVSESTIPNIGKGLFAKTPIKKNSIIVEFKGKLIKPTDNVTSNRSLIRFSDGSFLECGPSDLASFTNDPIQFPTARRKLYEALEKEDSFYCMNNSSTNNSYIKLNEKLHRAFLVALDDIDKDAEIFCHYGFAYWFMKEFTNGFLYEDRLDKGIFPKLYDYPAFKLYVNTFYPTFTEFKVAEYDSGETDVIICYAESNINTVIHLEDYSKILRKTVFNKEKN